MKVFLKILLIVIAILAVTAGCGVFYITRGLDSGEKLVINAVDLSNLNDGTYNGTYDSGRWSNEMSVTVKDHKITTINVIKDVKFQKPEVTQKVINEVIGKQNTNVDVISGATVTTKAYLKSIENALAASK